MRKHVDIVVPRIYYGINESVMFIHSKPFSISCVTVVLKSPFSTNDGALFLCLAWRCNSPLFFSHAVESCHVYVPAQEWQLSHQKGERARVRGLWHHPPPPSQKGTGRGNVFINKSFNERLEC